MTDEEKISRLMQEFDYNPVTANAYLEAKGVCTFCGEDVFASLAGFWSAQIDHLLPESRYPDLKWEPLNNVYACFRCNQRKRCFDPLESLAANGIEVADPRRALRERRSEIIEAVRSLMKPVRDADAREYNATLTLIRDP